MWHSAPADELVSEKWGNTFVVYHKPSGKTHFLNQAMFDLLTRVLCEPCTLDAAIRQLAELNQGDPGRLMGEQLLGLLQHLEQLGLVYRA